MIHENNLKFKRGDLVVTTWEDTDKTVYEFIECKDKVVFVKSIRSNRILDFSWSLFRLATPEEIASALAKKMIG